MGQREHRTTRAVQRPRVLGPAHARPAVRQTQTGDRVGIVLLGLLAVGILLAVLGSIIQEDSGTRLAEVGLALVVWVLVVGEAAEALFGSSRTASQCGKPQLSSASVTPTSPR